MSNENAPHIFKHTDDRHVQTRLDYMLIYRSESKAKIVRILETWMDTKYAESFKGTADSKEQKAEPPTEDLWITMSYDQFSLFVYGTIQHDTIKQQVDELVESKHVERRIHPVYPYGPPQYRLNRELVQKALDELEIPGNLFDLLPMFVTPRKKRTPQEKYPHPGGKKQGRDPGKIPPGTGETSYPSNNTTKNTKKHTENEGTYPREDQHSQHGASAHTPAPVSSLETTSYQPDSYSHNNEEDTSHGSDIHGDLHGSAASDPARGLDSGARVEHSGSRPQAPGTQEGDGTHQGHARGSSQQPTTTVAPDASGYRTVQQATQTGARPQQGARTQGNGTKQNEKPQLTLLGSQVRSDYEIIRACRLRMTPNNVKALNEMGDMDGMDFVNLKEVIEVIEGQNLVKTKNIPIDPQALASEDGYWRFDKWLQVVLRNRQKREQPRTPKGDNNLADWVAEDAQQRPQLSPEESARLTEEARKQLAAVQQQIAASQAAKQQQQAVIYRVKGETYA